jgi:SAM-dependent methyltransferase
MKLIEKVHGSYIHERRSRVLARHIAELLPEKARVLDVGCGDGLVASLIAKLRPDIEIRGLDVMVREQTLIPVDPFDGQHLPCPDASFDAVIFVDVLHHTDDPSVLLREARRVTRRCIIIKDHDRSGPFAQGTLEFMDRIGNARHGVILPYNYWSRREWLAACEQLSLQVSEWRDKLGIYPPPASWLFERSLHFISRLDLKK